MINWSKGEVGSGLRKRRQNLPGEPTCQTSWQQTSPKVSHVAQVRKFLIKIKKVNGKDQKNTTETNVVEEWNELYLNALG